MHIPQFPPGPFLFPFHYHYPYPSIQLIASWLLHPPSRIKTREEEETQMPLTVCPVSADSAIAFRCLALFMEEPSEDDVSHGGGDDLVSDREAAASPESGVSTGSLCSSAMSSLTDNDADDDGAESAFSAIGDRTSWSSSSSSSDTMQLGGDARGPLYEMSPLLAHLPASCHRTGLSKYYKGKSQSFTSLSDVKCLQDLEKKASPYASRIKKTRSSISNHVPGPCGKTMAKKTQPKSSSDRLLSRAKSSGLLRRRGKPPVYQSKQELSTYVS